MSWFGSVSVFLTLSFSLIFVFNFAVAEFTQSEISDVLRLHNRARCTVTPSASTMPALTWDPLLAQVMQRYLDSCPGYAHNPQRSNWYSQLGGSGSVGENLAWGYETILDATDGWLSEGSLYTYAKLDVNGASGCSTKNWADCGHYTQIIWSGTTRVGCARGSVPCSNLGGNANYAWGCNYASAGNIVGAFPYLSSSTQVSTDACQSGSSTPCPSNLASVATVSYSSAKPFVTQQLYDNNPTTGWVPVTNNANEQLKFDFGKVITISQIQVDFPKPDKIPQSLALKLKLADGTVSTVAVWSNNKGDKSSRSKTFNPPIQASIVRFVVQTPGALVTKIGDVKITGEISGGC